MTRRPALATALLALFAIGLARSSGADNPQAPGEKDLSFTDAQAQSAEFIGYYKSIQLTPEQEAIKKEALTALPAPCCKENTALTCCCPCNLAKSWWGLSHYLIAKKGYNAVQVRDKVAEWMKFVNPNGFSGHTCSTGGCGKPFNQSGCGGMQGAVVF